MHLSMTENNINPWLPTVHYTRDYNDVECIGYSLTFEDECGLVFVYDFISENFPQMLQNADNVHR